MLNSCLSPSGAHRRRRALPPSGGELEGGSRRGARAPLLCFLLVLLVLLLLPSRHPQPHIAPAAAADFEHLAGAVGRADTWHLLHSSDAPLPLAAHVPDRSPARPVTLTHSVHLPLVTSAAAPMVERRALWITRYDWTSLTHAPQPHDIDTIVANAAGAGFNTLFFQVRGAGDAYYTPGIEPWAARLTTGPVSTTLGIDPGWDPLARMIEVGHAAGLEVHAYVNVYPAWQSPPNAAYGDLWPPATTPPQMFDRFTYGPTNTAHPGEHALGYAWRQYTGGAPPKPMALAWNSYLWASPGVDLVHEHILAVVTDIARRYPIDGIHLDLVRYAGAGYSYDPSSNAAEGSTPTPERDQWQRDRITALIRRINEALPPLGGELEGGILLSAAVWPYYIDKWGWGLSEGYTDYYQDSKGWLTSGAVDAIAPMLYGGLADDPTRWAILMHDFLADGQGLPVYPGIGANNDIATIATRIEATRAAGAQGHAIFSYSALAAQDAWDDLASGPYRVPAILP